MARRRPIPKAPIPVVEDNAKRHAPHRGHIVYTRAEVAEHEQVVRQAIIGLASDKQIQDKLFQDYGVRKFRALKLIARVKEAWREADDKARATWKAEAMRRIQRYIVIASGRRNTDGSWAERPNHTAIARYEELLSKMQGTQEPFKIDVDVRVSETVQHVIMGLTPEQVNGYFQRYQENVQLAQRYRELEAHVPSSKESNGAKH